MSAGDTAEGKRCPDVEDPSQPHDQLEECGYRREAGVWFARPPGTPHGGSIAKHEVTEHEDGTITVSPSILLETTWAGKPVTWHGYLEHGVWREV